MNLTVVLGGLCAWVSQTCIADRWKVPKGQKLKLCLDRRPIVWIRIGFFFSFFWGLLGDIRDLSWRLLDTVCRKKQQTIVPDQLLVRGVGGPLKDLKDSELILNKSKLFPWLSRISLVPFKTFRGLLFPKPVTGQELFFAVSYNKPALIFFLVQLNYWLYEPTIIPFFHTESLLIQKG